MAKEFSELIKNFDKIRDYMRDFFIYGYKTRADFQYKSLRTYDNERRRIESWLGDIINFDSNVKGKQISLSCDSGRLFENPLYKAYESKSFTNNDIMLHFFIFDILSGGESLSINEITDRICNNYMVYLDPQIIRLKLTEYTKEGIVISQKQGRSLVYSVSMDTCFNFCKNTKDFHDMACFFAQASPIGVVGYYLQKQLNLKNTTFLTKHHYIVHALEENTLLTLLTAMNEKKNVNIINFGKRHQEVEFCVVPLRIHISTQTGRRYLIAFFPARKRFTSFRLDYIRSAKLNEVYENFDFYREKYYKNLDKCWGLSFGKRERSQESVKMTVHVDEEKEEFIIDRLKRESRGGTVLNVDKNIYSYEKNLFDTSEASPWFKTFMGRIKAFECDNKQVEERFHSDIKEMYEMYFKFEN